MTRSNGRNGKGAVISYCTTANGSYTELAEVRKISGSERTVKEIDVTSQSSADGYDEVAPGNIKAGPVGFDFLYEKAQRASLEAQLAVAQYWKVTYNDAAVDSFYGFLAKLGQETPHDDVMSCPASVTVSGKVTFTPGAAQVPVFTIAMTAGSGSIDFTAMPDPSGTLDGTGKKVKKLTLTNLATNANAMTITVPEVNGYAITASTMVIPLAVGQSAKVFGDDDSPAVAANAKLLTITGTGAQVLKVEAVLE